MIYQGNNKFNKKPNKKKLFLVSGLAILSIALIFGALIKFTNFSLGPIGKADVVNQDDTAETTSTAKTAQRDFNSGNDRQIPETDKNEGIVTDDNGSGVDAGDKSNWTTSSDGEITVYNPVADSKLVDGGKISGASTLDNIQFRLIDDVSGVISQGQLKVVNGKFSGTFDFSTTASKGRVDVYATKSDGSEYANTEVTVRFK